MRQITRLILGVFFVLLFIGCGGSSNDGRQQEYPVVKGVVYDDMVANMDYKTANFSGKTDRRGEFKYQYGKVDFYLAKLKIGSISQMTGDKKVFLSDMLDLPRGDYQNEKLVKLARLLHSLNTLPKESKKISLNTETIDRLFQKETTLDDIDLDSLKIPIVSADEAKERVKATYIEQSVPLLDNTNTVPIAKAGDDITKSQGEAVIFNGNNSSDVDGNIVKYEWFEEDTLLHVGAMFTKSDFSTGTHTITLKVTDDKGAIGIDTIIVTIQETLNTQPLKLTSVDIADNETLNNAFIYNQDCNGNNKSPALSWENAPANTKSFALSVQDPDGGNWWHWVVFNIPSTVTSLAQSASNNSMPAEAIEAQNSFEEKGYGGACPPQGSGVHHYIFTIYALDIAKLPNVNANSTGNEVKTQIDLHTISKSSITPIYERN